MNPEVSAQIAAVICVITLSVAITSRKRSKFIRILMWILSALLFLAFIYFKNVELFDLLKYF